MAGPFSYANWFRSLKAGRSFATNGPMLFLSADGRGPGDVLRVDGARRQVRLRAEALSPRPLDRLELVVNGRMVRTVTTADEAGRWVVESEATFSHDGWAIARAFEPAGRTIRFAHTSPVYVEAGRPAPAADDARFFIEWIDREIAFYQSSDEFRDPRHRAEMVAFFRQAREVYARLRDNASN